jgi:hypothetical protein
MKYILLTLIILVIEAGYTYLLGLVFLNTHKYAFITGLLLLAIFIILNFELIKQAAKYLKP